MNSTTLRAALLSDWGPAIKTTARAVAAVAVACYVAGYTCYVAGYMLGAWLHRTSAALARYWVGLWVRPGADPGCLPPAPAPAVHPLAILADTLQAQPVTTLRRTAGVRSKRYRKGALVAMLVAC
jgi:hypothetical protein